MYVRALRPVPLVGVVVVAVLVGSGCSAGSGATGAGGAVPVLTQAQLRGLAFKEGEVVGAHPDGVPVQAPRPQGTPRSRPPVSDPACRTVLDVRNGKRAAAVVRQVFNWQGDFWGGGSTLASYRDGEARRAFDRLQRALGACRSYEDTGWEGRFTATLTAEPTPDIGDEAVRFRETVPPGPGELGARDEQFTVVRAGNTIATFHKLSVGGSVSFPADLVNRQVRRLQDAQRP